MKVQVEFLGLPVLSDLIGKKTEVDFNGRTIDDLVTHLIVQYGQEVRRFLLDKKGKLELTIQVMVNNDGYVNRDRLAEHVLKEDDKVRFLLLVGGG
jgi:sulfur carrier protein ThiS